MRYFGISDGYFRQALAEKAYERDEAMAALSGRLKTDKEPDAKQFIRIFNLLEKEPRLAPLLHSPRLANAAKQLEDMAGGVRFYQAQSFYKEPGDTGSLWHSDSYACPLDTNNQLTTAWVPMVEVEREMGVLASARGSHQVILPTAPGVSNEGRSSPLLVPLPAVSWLWVPAWGSLEPPRRDGENAQKTRKNGGKMGEIRPKRCEGRELTKDQLAAPA